MLTDEQYEEILDQVVWEHVSTCPDCLRVGRTVEQYKDELTPEALEEFRKLVDESEPNTGPIPDPGGHDPLDGDVT